MPESLVIAVAQPLAVPYDVGANASTHAATIRAAGARVVVFPEMSLTGYELDAPAITGADERLTPIVSACAETGTLALVGAPLQGDEGRVHIAMLAVTGSTVTVAYRKVCVDSSESRFSPGAPAVIEVDGYRLGLGICKDTGIAEHAAATAALGIDIYVAGTLMFAHEAGIQDARARRIATGHHVPVAFASHAGPTGGGYTDCAGRSGIWAADGSVLAQAGPAPGDRARALLPGISSADQSRPARDSS